MPWVPSIQRRVLRLLLGHHEARFSATELIFRCRFSSGAVQCEIVRLVEIRLVNKRMVGR